jgi:hypothetical protein
MAPEALAELHSIQRRVMGLPEPLERLFQLEQLLCGFLTYEDRQKYGDEYKKLTRFPWKDAA